MSDFKTELQIRTRRAGSHRSVSEASVTCVRPVGTGPTGMAQLFLTFLLAVIAVPGSGNSAFALKKTGPARFAVDLVTLDSGERLRGAFTGMDADGVVSMAVQREWLKNTRPELYDQVTRHEIADSKAALTELRNRIRRWLDEKPDANELVTFLEIELERVDGQLSGLEEKQEAAGSSQFLIVKFPRHRVKYSYAQSARNRRIATLAWRERLEDIETRDATDLERQLRDEGIDPAAETADLSSRLPAERQSDVEWSARRAVVEFDLVNKLEFQGIGRSLVRTDSGAGKVGLEQLLPQLLPQLLQDQLGGQLAELLNEPGARPQDRRRESTPDLGGAIREAERVGAQGFRVTTVDLNLQSQQAVVETRFVAKLPEGSWETIWSHREVRDSTKRDADLKRRIESDPQISEAFELVNSLGVGTGGHLETAISFGAATMEAQQAADQAFFRFLDRSVRRLDGPRLSWSRSQPE